MEEWLKALSTDWRSPRPPTYGELRIDEGGHVVLGRRAGRWRAERERVLAERKNEGLRGGEGARAGNGLAVAAGSRR